MYWLKELDPVETLISRPLYALTKDLLSFPAVVYRSGLYRKIRESYMKQTKIGTTKEGVLIYTGFISRILDFCARKNIEVDARLHPLLIKRKKPSYPRGFSPRDFQILSIDQFFRFGRGVIVAPTGTGKTSLGLTLVSCVDGLESVLWLCHKVSLMRQTAEAAAEFFGNSNVGMLGDGIADTSKFLTIATRQTYEDYADDLGTAHDLVIVDETHHVSSFDGKYAEILRKTYAPYRIGLTATTPTQPEAVLALEALIGPLISQLTIEEGREKGYMADIKISIIKIPTSLSVRDLRKYADVYEHGVVRRLERNRRIVGLVKQHYEKGEAVLIVVNKLAHGDLLYNLCKKENIPTKYVYGITDSESRALAQKKLNEKELCCVIATDVWKEGINIPELNVVINAAGGKSDIATLQSIGRGLRKTSTKDTLIVYDFFDDSHPYLISHFGHRFSLYCEMGWIK